MGRRKNSPRGDRYLNGFVHLSPTRQPEDIGPGTDAERYVLAGVGARDNPLDAAHERVICPNLFFAFGDRDVLEAHLRNADSGL